MNYPDFKKSAILIVDDQESNLEVLKDFLEIQGYFNLKAIQDPLKVRYLFNEFHPDLILLDLIMPGLSGYEVMEQLKPLIPANTFLPILVLTADITKEARQKALSGGATDFLTKPFDLTEVGLRIRNLLYTRYLNQQVLKQNINLEEKVRERTQELEKKNTELRNAMERAESADRLKTAFINRISHEVRTPLNSILGFGQLLTEPGLMPSDKINYLSLMKVSSTRLISLITNFIDISLIQSGTQQVIKEEVDVNQLILEVTNQYKDFCTVKNVNFNISIVKSRPAPLVFTDRELLRKILAQLVDNAVKFTSQGFISVGYEIHENEIRFFIKDSGIGIAEENQGLIFEKFMHEDHHVERDYEGSGLGLSIAKGFANLLGGRIWFESKKGSGSTFYVAMPVLRRIRSVISGGNLVQSPGSGVQTILVAEDDDFNFFYLSKLLSYPSIEILHAKDGLEAVSYCINRTDIRIVLMDLKMPEMDGFEATKAIRKIRPDLIIIALTAYTGSEDKQKAILAGCNDFLSKPIEKNLLIRKLVNNGIIIPF